MTDLNILKGINVIKVIDILCIILVTYQIYQSVKSSIVIDIIMGLVLLYLLYLLVHYLKMNLLSSLLGRFVEIGMLIPFILFQREIKRFLSIIGGRVVSGQNKLISGISWPYKKKKELDVTPFVKAAQILGGSNIGALIVLSKDADVRFYTESGDLIDAIVSTRLFIAIFNKESPLHDGAVIVHNNRVIAARCILPVSENQSIPGYFGLRHRAAIGMTEVMDALVLIVSEESGQISIAQKGKIESNLSVQEIRSAIKEYFK